MSLVYQFFWNTVYIATGSSAGAYSVADMPQLTSSLRYDISMRLLVHVTQCVKKYSLLRMTAADNQTWYCQSNK